MATGAMTVHVRVDDLTQKALALLKLGPPREMENGACVYCRAPLGSDEEGFVAAAHNPDCAWVTFAAAVSSGLIAV